MSDPFTLRVPVDPRYRVLAPEVAGRYVDILGGGAAEREALRTAIDDAITELAERSSAHHVDLAFSVTPDGVQVTLRCAGHSTTVRQALAAARH